MMTTPRRKAQENLSVYFWWHVVSRQIVASAHACLVQFLGSKGACVLTGSQLGAVSGGVRLWQLTTVELNGSRLWKLRP